MFVKFHSRCYSSWICLLTVDENEFVELMQTWQLFCFFISIKQSIKQPIKKSINQTITV